MLANKDLVFCEINYRAENVEEMAPDLHRLINNCDKWRAVIVAPLPKDKLNPFDYTDFRENISFQRKGKINWDSFLPFLENRKECYKKAVENPLIKFTCALGRTRSILIEDDIDEYQNVMAGKLPIYKLMVERRLNGLNIPKTINWITKYGNGELEKAVSPDGTFEDLIDAISNEEIDKIISIVGIDNVPKFTKHLTADDPTCSDPYYVVTQLDKFSKELQLESISNGFTFFDIKPQEIICIAQRSCDTDFLRLNLKYKAANFAEFNLYPENAKFVLYDILPQFHRQYEQDYIKYLTLILIFANNEFPVGSVDARFVYSADLLIDKSRFYEITGKYDAKLSATKREINRIIENTLDEECQPLDKSDAHQLFESNILIPVSVDDEYKKNEMFAKWDEIGLTYDCPVDESTYWSAQYKDLENKFVRFLREPRRALKSAVKGDFYRNRIIDDSRARNLNEFQAEDVIYRLREEEKKMVETNTANLFESEKFVDKIRDADKAVKKEISYRITKKSAIISSAVACLAFLLGFFPLIFSNMNTVKSASVSLIMTLICLSVFLICGLLALFRFKRKLIGVIQNFNATISSLFSDIAEYLRGFSSYLSHACNVMRENYVLKIKDVQKSEAIKILQKHIYDIDCRRSMIRSVYSDYFDFNEKIYTDAEPYEYDFTVLNEYDYEFDYIPAYDNVEYIEPGNSITVEVDYVKSIKLVKENFDGR